MGSPQTPASGFSRPPGSRPPRPWYLLVALIAAWLLGAVGLMSGGSIVAFYREDASELRQSLDRDEEHLLSEDERALLRERTERLNDVLERAKKREFPLGVGTLVLGGAMVALAARSMSGREGARGALVQVTLARAALVAAAFFLTADVRAAEFAIANLVGYLSMGGMILQGLTCLLVVIALTRRGSRAFFRAAEDSIWER
jgi:hypothetical protein